ncbi:hypothetical protein [Streptomyces niveiscabiei]|uniref:Uncharacterized protein n=1 Tax=Streptomyces niveiscabiei TaxID=164115 RepID=A0ABW9I888_9ACTN
MNLTAEAKGDKGGRRPAERAALDHGQGCTLRVNALLSGTP